MSIEIGKQYIGKDGEVVEVENIKDNHFDNHRTSRIDCVWFWNKQGSIHVLTERDFLEQYKPYEEPKQTVMIEKWLCSVVKDSYYVIEGTKEFMSGRSEKVKLLYTYEIEL